MTVKNSSNNIASNTYTVGSGRCYTVGSGTIFVGTPLGQNNWFNDLINRINKTTFWADSISFDILCNDKTKEQLKRICLIASVQCEEKNLATFCDLKIVITSVKDLDRILPEFIRHFPNSKKFKKEYLQQYKEFFGDV